MIRRKKMVKLRNLLIVSLILLGASSFSWGSQWFLSFETGVMKTGDFFSYERATSDQYKKHFLAFSDAVSENVHVLISEAKLGYKRGNSLMGFSYSRYPYHIFSGGLDGRIEREVTTEWAFELFTQSYLIGLFYKYLFSTVSWKGWEANPTLEIGVKRLSYGYGEFEGKEPNVFLHDRDQVSGFHTLVAVGLDMGILHRTVLTTSLGFVYENYSHNFVDVNVDEEKEHFVKKGSFSPIFKLGLTFVFY